MKEHGQNCGILLESIMAMPGSRLLAGVVLSNIDWAAGEEFNQDSIERDERRLTELGRRTIEIFVLAHIFSKIEVAYQEAVSLKRQEELIREEEAAWLAETEQKGKRGAMDKEKKTKKKQGKQKRNSRKGKDKGRDDKPNNILEGKIEQDNPTVERKDFLAAVPEMILEKSDAAEDVSDASDSVDCVPEILPPDSEDRDTSPVNWDTDTSEVQPPTGASSSGISGLSGVQNGIEGRSSSVVDDSSSTCSSDSVPSVVITVHHKGNSRYQQNPKSPSRGRNYQSKVTPDTASWVSEERNHTSEAVRDTGHPNDASQSSNTVESLSQATIRTLQDRVVHRTNRHVVKKEEETGSLRRNFSVKDAVDGLVSGDRAACVMSSPQSPSKSIPSIAPPKLESIIDGVSDLVMVRKPSSDSPKHADRSMRLVNSVEIAATVKPDTQKFTTPKSTEKLSGHQIPGVNERYPTQHVPVTTDKSSVPPMPAMSRPLSAPLNLGPRPAVSMVSMVQITPILARSVSATDGLGPEPTGSATSSYAPQSYLNAMIGSPVTGSLSAYTQNHSASSLANASHSYPQASALVSAPLFSPHSSDRMDPNPIHPNFSFGMVNHHDVLQNVPLWMECPQRDSCRNFAGDHRASLINDMQSFDLYNPVHIRSQDHLSSEFSACTSGRQSHVLADEFPHLDIINDLLDDEHGTGKVARANAGYRSFSNGPLHVNRQFSFPGDLGITSGLGQSTNSCRFERTRSYHDDGFQYGYGASGSPYDTLRDMIPQASPRQYVNGQIDGLIPNQWQRTGNDVPFLSVRNTDNGGYPYHRPDYPNLTVGVNGYTVFRPSNGL